jgi:hypothetical protein
MPQNHSLSQFICFILRYSWFLPTGASFRRCPDKKEAKFSSFANTFLLLLCKRPQLARDSQDYGSCIIILGWKSKFANTIENCRAVGSGVEFCFKVGGPDPLPATNCQIAGINYCCFPIKSIGNCLT